VRASCFRERPEGLKLYRRNDCRYAVLDDQIINMILKISRHLKIVGHRLLHWSSCELVGESARLARNFQ